MDLHSSVERPAQLKRGLQSDSASQAVRILGTFRFLDLPFELRQQIYEVVLVSLNEISLNLGYNDYLSLNGHNGNDVLSQPVGLPVPTGMIFHATVSNIHPAQPSR